MWQYGFGFGPFGLEGSGFGFVVWVLGGCRAFGFSGVGL